MRVAACAAALLLAAACSNELPQEDGANRDGDPKEGTPLTLTASLPGGEGANTRVSHKDEGTSGVKLTWTAGDAFRLYTGDPFSGAGTPEQAGLFTWQGNDGSGNANLFKGTLTATKPDGSLGYAAYYPADKFPETLDAMSGIPLTGQVQNGNGDMAHLAAYNIMRATLIDDLTKPIQFESMLTLLTFDLTMPADVTTQNAPTMLKIAANNSSGPTNNFTGTIFNSGAPDRVSELSLGLKDITMGTDNKLKAYMLVYPFGLSGHNFSITVSTPAGDYTYKIENKTKTYEAGKRYTATVADASGWNKMEAMKFTVKTEDNNKYFSIPFSESGRTPANANITVDWGDGKTSSVPKGSTLSVKDAFKHQYSTAGTYTITITSDAPATEQQIPSLNFKNNRSDYGNNSAMLVSLDTPLLNTANKDFSNTFYQCINLTTIDKELFIKNPQVTNFSNCFTYCYKLTEAPKELFEKHPDVTDFSYCFYSCTTLTTVPEELFAKNTKVTSFNACFFNCPKLETVPEGLFAQNTNVTNFGYCFNACPALKTVPKGLFAKNTKVTSFAYCFQGCTALTAIPDGFFAQNAEATNFRNCFDGCTSLVLTPNIFIEGSITRENRFSSVKTQCFFYECFNKVGSNTTTPGNAPDLWNYAYYTTPSSEGCFTSCNIWDTDKVPSPWGYPKKIE